MNAQDRERIIQWLDDHNAGKPAWTATNLPGHSLTLYHVPPTMYVLIHDIKLDQFDVWIHPTMSNHGVDEVIKELDRYLEDNIYFEKTRIDREVEDDQ